MSITYDRDRLRFDMIYYKGDTHLVLEATFEEMIMRVMHDTPSIGLSGDLYEHEVAYMAELLYRKVSRLQALLEYIIRSRVVGFPGWFGGSMTY
jgi:hypothetical protein